MSDLDKALDYDDAIKTTVSRSNQRISQKYLSCVADAYRAEKAENTRLREAADKWENTTLSALGLLQIDKENRDDEWEADRKEWLISLAKTDQELNLQSESKA